MNELGEAIIAQARIDMIMEAVGRLNGKPITVENVAALAPADACIDVDDLDHLFPRTDDVRSAVHLEAVPRDAPLPEPLSAPESMSADIGNEFAQREQRKAKARTERAEPELLPHLQERNEAQAHLNKCCEAVGGLQAHREVLRRKVANARDSLSRAIGAWQEHGQRSPAEVTRDWVKDQSEIRRAQMGTHGDVIRRQRAAAFVRKQMTGGGNAAMRGPGEAGQYGLPKKELMSRQIRETGRSLPFNRVLAAPKNPYGD